MTKKQEREIEALCFGVQELREKVLELRAIIRSQNRKIKKLEKGE